MTSRRLFLAFTLCAGLALAPVAQAALPAAVQAKVDTYKKKMVEWAANPALIKAANEANAKGAGGMSNAKWEELADNDAAVQATMTGPIRRATSWPASLAPCSLTQRVALILPPLSRVKSHRGKRSSRIHRLKSRACSWPYR